MKDSSLHPQAYPSFGCQLNLWSVVGMFYEKGPCILNSMWELPQVWQSISPTRAYSRFSAGSACSCPSRMVASFVWGCALVPNKTNNL